MEAKSGTNPKIPVHEPKASIVPKEQNGKEARTNVNHSSSSVNVTTVTKEVELAAPANMLWDLLFDPTKIPLWSKAPAKMDIKVPGSPFEMFNGAISGTVVEAKMPERAVQKWRIESWPSGHYGNLKTQLIQGSNTTQGESKLKYIFPTRI